MCDKDEENKIEKERLDNRIYFSEHGLVDLFEAIFETKQKLNFLIRMFYIAAVSCSVIAFIALWCLLCMTR